MQTYIYNKDVNPSRLAKEIRSNINITIGLISITKSNDNTNITFKTDLSAGEKTELDSLVDAHTNTPLDDEKPIMFQRALSSRGNFILRPIGFNFDVAAGTTKIHKELWTENLALRGGFLIADGFKLGDAVSLRFVDDNNVLGLGAGFVVQDYIKSYPLRPYVNENIGMIELIDEDISDKIPIGLYLEVTYVSTGVDNINCSIGLLGYK